MKSTAVQPEPSSSKPDSNSGSKPDAKDDLKTLPMAEVEKKLGSSPEGLSQAEAQKRLKQYGPNEIAEKKTNALLKFLSYFWGPIPWMIEVGGRAVRHRPALARFLHHPAIAGSQRHHRLLGRTPGGQRHRCAKGQAGDQGPGQAGWQMDHPGGAGTGAGRRHTPAPRRHRAGGCALAGRRRGVRRSVRAHRRIIARHIASPATRYSPGRSSVAARSGRWSMRRVEKPISARPPNWWRRQLPSAISRRRC